MLDIDRRIRQTTLPPVRLYLKPDEEDYNNPALTMKGWLMSQYRSIGKSLRQDPRTVDADSHALAMLYIHRYTTP